MRYPIVLLFSFFIICQSCNKAKTINVNSGLASAFGYKTGSYWIYKDSVSGETDSAYVISTDVEYSYNTCVLSAAAPKYEWMYISLQVTNGNSLDTERWNFSMEESRFFINLYNNSDKIESREGFNLFNWPLAPGPSQHVGCDPAMDNGSVTDIIPEVALNGQSYSSAARSAHSINSGDTSFMYNDCFYLNKDAGIIKIVFNHPSDSVHRVLELQRYHIVR